MAQANIQRVTGITGTGVAIPPQSSPGGAPFATYGLQIKGVGGTLTSWSVTLDVSLDGNNWTSLVTHTATDGSTQWDAAGKPNLWYRVNVGALSLGTATSISINAVAVP